MMILASAWVCLTAAPPQEALAARPRHELTSLLEADGRQYWTLEGEPYTGAVQESYDNGMRLETALVDGYEHGTHQLAFSDGRLAREVEMRAGREHGRTRMWREDGRPYVLEHFGHGEPIGPQLRWGSNGRLERDELLLGGADVGWSLDALSRWGGQGLEDSAAHLQFWRAVVHAREGDLAAALGELTASLEAGYPTPMDAVGLGVLSALADDPTTRPELMKLFDEHARQSSLVMVSPSEPGEPFVLDVRIVDAASGEPIPGAWFHLHQTDATGYYFREEGAYNPRLSAAGRADGEGRLRVRTIRPGHYPSELDPDGSVPAHFHVKARAPGYPDAWPEAILSDDERRPAAAGNELQISVSRRDGLSRGELTFRLRRG